MERLPAFIERKQQIATRYDAVLRNVPGVTIPPRPAWAKPTLWLYSVLIDPSITGVDRKWMLAHLAGKGIQTRPVWAPAHMMPFYADAPRRGGAIGDRLFSQGLSLPCSTGLTDGDQDRVIDAVLSALRLNVR